MVVFRRLRPRLARLSSHPPAQVLGDEGRSKRTFRGTAPMFTTTLPKEGSPIENGSFFSSLHPIPKLYLPYPCPWHWRLARDRHMCVRVGCKVTWISRKDDKAHWWYFVACYENECNVSRRCWRENIAQTIYWKADEYEKSVFCKKEAFSDSYWEI